MRAVSVYEYWSPGDWIEHYAGARFDPRWAAYGSLWDRQGRSLPMYQAGQTLAFNGERLSEAREFPLGFYEAAVPPVCTPGTAAAGPGTTNVVTAPLYGLTGSLFGTTLDIAPNFAVYDIKIGNRSQLANSVALPAETFVEGAVGVRLSLATAVVAMDVAIVVANLTKTPQDFRGALIGTAFL